MVRRKEPGNGQLFSKPRQKDGQRLHFYRFYSEAFCLPPSGVEFSNGDFSRINAVLFPGEPETLEVLEWTSDLSDYSENGSEWWGTACFTASDRGLERYAVIRAPATD